MRSISLGRVKLQAVRSRQQACGTRTEGAEAAWWPGPCWAQGGFIESKYDVDLALRAACRWSSLKSDTGHGAVSDMDLQASEMHGRKLRVMPKLSLQKLPRVGEKLQPSRRCAALWQFFPLGSRSIGPLGGAPARRYVNKWVHASGLNMDETSPRMLREVHLDPASVQNKLQ